MTKGSINPVIEDFKNNHFKYTYIIHATGFTIIEIVLDIYVRKYQSRVAHTR